MKIHTLVFSPFQVNTYILADKSGECAIIDPACSNPAEQNKLSNFLSRNKLKPVRLLNTHCHLDHVFGNNYVSDTYGLDSESSKKEEPVLLSAKDAATRYGVEMEQPYPAGKHIEEGEEIKFADSRLEILHAPGHTPGSLVFYSPEDKFAIVGDVLFSGSIGRTDLPGGNHQQLLDAIAEKLYSLPDETIVCPGHGAATSIGEEKKSNPFVRG